MLNTSQGQGQATARVGLIGAKGRMGKSIATELWSLQQAGSGPSLAGLAVRAGDGLIGQPASDALGLAGCDAVSMSTLAALPDGLDVLIDFSSAAALADNLAFAREKQLPILIGTTGLDDQALSAIDAAAADIPVILAANTSLGINLLLDTVARLSATLPADLADIEIVEMHHGGKRDAPSGTALALGEAAAAGRGRSLAEIQKLSREGDTGIRPDGQIGFATLRGGDVAGEHTVIFATAGERIELTHRCTDRAVFARGAVRAAVWLAAKRGQPGRYTMSDVLGLV
ncbi:MAG: 4-hydroxy-tetrahydrodipicolinate reductase [Alphaproteobacteria bacterium]|nr:4-hydroxy-tetrahydrodipicolinate reductase [Alphaproteobacteria bacterium SS10]